MYELTNPQASPRARRLMELLCQWEGKYVVSAQHTKTVDPVELRDIQKITGKLPAMAGFELLGYSPNVNYLDTDPDAIGEVMANRNTMDTAIAWAEQGGIVTYTYHWFSPLGGRNKSFYTQYTDFDLSCAMEEGSPEHTALLRDLDMLADYLKRFRDLDIPILWRPLHEAEGGWFWWGAKGPEPCKWLWRFMYERFTVVHGLHNLIWVWNSPDPQWYPGDDWVDILSCDIYTDSDTPSPEAYQKLKSFRPDKLVALAECGIHPSAERMFTENATWSWSMNWCFGDMLTATNPPENCGKDGLAWWNSIKPDLEKRTRSFYADPRVLCLGDFSY